MRTLVTDGRDRLTPPLRARALDAAYRQVHLTMGMIDDMLWESRGSWNQRQNDNDDPNAIDWSGFQTAEVDALRPKLFDLPEAKGFDGYYLGQRTSTRWADRWLASLRSRDYDRYLDEAAEQIAAACIYWRDHVGPVPTYLQPFNEPLSGNRELAGGTTRDLVDLVSRVGDRLTREGFGYVRFVVPSEESEEASLRSAQAILADPHARAYVGAIGYHPYPLTSAYANVPRLLHTSGRGHPERDRIAVRARLRDLAHRYGLPLWMTEVAQGGVDPRSYDDFRGRAIHIHDELTYADASVYSGMVSMADRTEGLHGSPVPIADHEGTVVLIDSKAGTLDITGIGRAIGHYARWVERGAVRIDAEAGDALLQATAFRDDVRRRLTLVLINNSGSARTAAISVDGVSITGPISGEESTPAAYWVPMKPFEASTSSRFEINMLALSVTTLVANVAPSAN
ncbi:MAG TPA: hypothetical protein VEU08_05415 [Vicinamibacterales bacterium]|nr:hypothetical protein [Vicinamibacterales bacterium]